MRTRSFLLPVLALILCQSLILSGCASKYGEQITQVNYYPQCYKPVGDLRADENTVAKSTAVGAAGGALLGAAIGALATGDWRGAAAGAVAGGAAGAVGGNIYGKHQQRQRDAAFLAQYAKQLDEDVASMNRTVAASKLASRCYNSEFKKIVADVKAQRISKQEFQDRYQEIRSGLQEISYILNARYDSMSQKDQEYQAALDYEYKAAPTKVASVPKKNRKTITGKAAAFKEAQQNLHDEKLLVDNYIETLDTEANLVDATHA